MDKIRSTELFIFLQENGYFEKGAKTLQLGKLAYRRAYKRNWIKKNRRIKKDVRIALDHELYELVKSYCKSQGTTVTALARRLLSSHSTGKALIPQKQKLQDIFRDIGLVINELYQDTKPADLTSKLEAIEQSLQAYLSLDKNPSKP